MNILIIVAHPDDEVLGAGGSIYKWTQEGHRLGVCVMCSEAKARAFRPDDEELKSDFYKSCDLLGIENIYEGDFPNIQMNNVPHLHLVQFIEKALSDFKPDIVITHHAADTNNDHVQTSIACQAAVRLFQRRPEIKRIKEVWFMEVPSSTEWNIDRDASQFTPNCYVEIGEDGIDAKIKALEAYRGVMRPYPHPRSKEYIKSLACIRGSEWGVDYAESFHTAIRIF